MNTEHDTLAPQALVFTQHAADKVMQLSSRQDASGSMLRVYIQGGGCSGFQYGFALENFDAIGRYREETSAGEPVDVRTTLIDGTEEHKTELQTK